MAYSAKFDTASAVARLEDVQKGLSNLLPLHELLVIEAQKSVFKNWPKGPGLAPLTLAARIRGGNTPLLDTGTLRQSITGTSPASSISTATGTLNEARPTGATIGTAIPWATTHNFGATIFPSRAKALAVPATPEASRARSPRNFPGLKFIPSKQPNCVGVLVTLGKARKGQKPPMTVQYILMKSVTIPARKFMPTAAEFAPTATKTASAYLSMLMAKRG